MDPLICLSLKTTESSSATLVCSLFKSLPASVASPSHHDLTKESGSTGPIKLGAQDSSPMRWYQTALVREGCRLLILCVRKLAGYVTSIMLFCHFVKMYKVHCDL